MDFTFSEDQLLFRDSVRDFLANEVTPERIRQRWETETGRSPDIWSALAELGLTGMLVPEEADGLGMNAVDFVLLAEECGRAALPEALVDHVLVATPLLESCDNEALKTQWLPKLANGEAQAAVGHSTNPCLADAHTADLLVLSQGGDLHALPKAAANLTAQESVDPCRKLFTVEWQPTEDTLIARGKNAEKLMATTFNHGALAAAAQMLGLAQRMIEMAVAYTSERQQFGKPVGSFQAVKHHMANVAVATEFAKAPVYRAAYSVAHDLPAVDQHVSHAKIAAGEAAVLAAKNCIQVHGAMGYTWEVDLHIWMKRAWVLDKAWGTRGVHKSRIANAIFTGDAALGAGHTFAA
ncbi:MAG: acyl-CoA dehydrogenase family protein [Pseudomonadales bacterium]